MTPLPLSPAGWVQAAISPYAFGAYQIADTCSHLVTLSLPGGLTEQFSAQLTVRGAANPLEGLGDVALEFAPFGVDQGYLTCLGNENTDRLDVRALDANGNETFDWDQLPLRLIIDAQDDPEFFVPNAFVYTAADGTRYCFELTNALSGRLTQVIDRNGNTLTYQYDSANPALLAGLQHSNGRQVQFDYLTNGAGVWVNLYDSAHPKAAGVEPVVKYLVHDQCLAEVHKLVSRTNGATAAVFETNTYYYGTSDTPGDPARLAANTNRLTDVFDPRGVRVLHNEYGTNDTGLPDGRLVSQTDALGHVTTLGLDTNNTLTASATVGGAAQTVTVTHDPAGAVASVQAGYQAATNTYNARGQLVAQTDAYGNTKTIGYDSLDRPTSQSDPLHHTTSTDYNSGIYNQPGSTTDALGHPTTFDYDNQGNLTASTDPADARTDTAYAGVTNGAGHFAAGLVASEVRSAPDVPYYVATRYTYYNGAGVASNLVGELQTVIERAEIANGLPLPGTLTVTNTYEYDANGNRTKEIRTINSQQSTTRYAYDSQNRLIQTIDALGRTNATAYNKLGKPAATTDAAGRVTLFTYDPAGNLIQTQYPDGTVTRATYDEKNRVLYAQERAWPYTNGPVTVTTNPASLNVYDEAGKVVRVERRAGVVLTKETATGFQGLPGAEPQWKLTVTAAGTPVSATRTQYDADGRVQYSGSARGAVTESQYDAAGRRIALLVHTNYVDPLDTAAIALSTNDYPLSTTSYFFDANGNQTAVVDALGHETDYEYDAMSRLIRTWFPQVDTNPPVSHSTAYDALGRRTREIDEAGVTTAYEYDFRGLLTKVILDFNPTNTSPMATAYEYDEAGSLTAQTDANGHTTRFEYDLLGRRTKRTLPENQAETFGYDLVGNLAFHTNFNGQVITNLYDIADRLTNRASVGYRASWKFNPVGLRTNMTDVSGVTGYAYDQLNLLTNKLVAWAGGPTKALNYRYDPAGALTNLWSSTANGVNLVYAYDLLGRLTNVLSSGALAANYGYDLAGNRQTLRYGNGVTNLYQYDARNRLTKLVAGRNGSSRASFAYQVAPTGQRTNLSEAIDRVYWPISQSYGWTYDRVYRLTQEAFSGTTNGTVAYAHDPVGNRTNQVSDLELIPTAAPTYTENDRLVGDTYDDNGDTTYSASLDSTCQYDPLGHLTNAWTYVAVALDYDGDGHRVKKNVWGNLYYYLVDDRNPTGYPQVVEEVDPLNPSDDHLVVYAYGLERLSQRRAAYGLSYYGCDGHGSVRYLTDAYGSISDSYLYDAFGVLIGGQQFTRNHYRYAGMYWDQHLRVYHDEAREYQAEVGRFWTRDTYEGNSEDPQSLHAYTYCQASPVNRIDPTGHDDFDMLLFGAEIYAYILKRVNPTYGPIGTGKGGPDVTDALNATLDDVEKWWAKPMPWMSKYDNALALRDWRGGGRGAWDILPLMRVGFEGDPIGAYATGTGSFTRTVAFNEHCYYANAVNYALWGKVNRLAHDFLAADSVWSIRWQADNYTLSEALKEARVWKHLNYGDYGIGTAEAEAFTKYGYNGTPVPLSVALPCKWSGQTLKGHPFAWTWLPHH